MLLEGAVYTVYTGLPWAEAVADRLERTGKLPISVRQQRSRARSLDELGRSFRRVKADDLTLFTRELATLLRAGIPMLATLRILEEQTRSELLREAVASAAQDVQGGVALSDGLSRFPRVFPGLYVSTIRAGESSGSMSEVLERLELALSDALSLPKGEAEGGLPVYRTDERGAVEVISDGARVWVETER